MIEIDKEDIETIKSLIEDHGFEYSLKTKTEGIIKLAQKIGLSEQYVKSHYKDWQE